MPITPKHQHVRLLLIHNANTRVAVPRRRSLKSNQALVLEQSVLSGLLSVRFLLCLLVDHHLEQLVLKLLFHPSFDSLLVPEEVIEKLAVLYQV